MATAEQVIARQLNLTFALLNADTKKPLDWITTHVDGYANRTPLALEKLIERDIKDIRRIGVPAHYAKRHVWIDKSRYELGQISLNEDEANALGLAVDLAQHGTLGAIARAGWTKLASTGVKRNFQPPVIAAITNDISQTDPDTIRGISACIQAKVRITVDYTAAPGQSHQRRVLEPWGLVTFKHRTYVVGWDTKKDDTRCFRISKLSNVRKARNQENLKEPFADPQQIVTELLRGEPVCAEITVEPGSAEELAQLGQRYPNAQPHGDSIVIDGVDREHLVRTIASAAPFVLQIAPADIRQEVVDLLATIANGSMQSAG